VDAAVLIAREQRSQLECYRSSFSRFGTGARGVVLEEGLFACVVPATPHRSILNSVLYTDPERVLAHHEHLLALYGDAGCTAWAVWVRPGDDALVEELLARGHHLDAEPTLMAAVLDELDLNPRVALELDPDPRWPDLGPINEAAYDLAAGTFAGALGRVPLDVGLRPLVARLDGLPVACVSWMATAEGDCAIQSVATLPEARGRGLASELLREALRRARAAGCSTTTLEGTAAGTPVYERLGYRTLGTLRMLEHRRAAA